MSRVEQMDENLQEVLINEESEFFYNALEIQNSSKFGQSAFRFWFNDFRENLNSREGDIYEFGVYRGSSLISIALLAKRLGSKKHFWGFDSFCGFPGFSPQDELKNFTLENGFSNEIINNHKLLLKLKSSYTQIRIKDNNLFKKIISYVDDKDLKESLKKLGKSGLFEDASYDGLMKKIQLLELDNITLIKGNFSETVDSHFYKNSKKVFSANIDCDLYEGYKITLPPLFNNLVNGGYIHLDEYYSLKYPGPKIATDEFLSKNPNAVLKQNKTRCNEFKRHYITKV